MATALTGWSLWWWWWWCWWFKVTHAQVPGFRAPVVVVVRAPSTGPWAFLFIVFHLVAAGPHRLDLCGTQLDWLLTVIDHNQNSAIVPFDYSDLWWFPGDLHFASMISTRISLEEVISLFSDGHVTAGGLRRHQHFRDRAGSMPSNKWHSSWQKKSLKGYNTMPYLYTAWSFLQLEWSQTSCLGFKLQKTMKSVPNAVDVSMHRHRIEIQFLEFPRVDTETTPWKCSKRNYTCLTWIS